MPGPVCYNTRWKDWKEWYRTEGQGFGARLRQLLYIFLITMKIGCVTFGGGLAMIPMIQNEFSEKHNWVSPDDIADITAVAQTLPGMVAMNASILTGYRVGGTAAAVAAGIGCILPSLVILCLVTVFYAAFTENPIVRGALRGVSGAVVALFVSALVKMSRKNIRDIWGVGIFLLAAVILFVFPSLNIIYVILGGGLLGFLIYSLLIPRMGGKQDHD